MGTDWDERYRKSSAPTEPASLLTSFEFLFPKDGKALDLACGAGRNSVWLAGRGLEVAAMDLSGEALRKGRELASRHCSHVTWLQENLQSCPLGSGAYDVIACFYIRIPALSTRVSTALRPGGWVVYETYNLAQLNYASGPRDPEHLLRTGELLEAFGGLEVVLYRATSHERGDSSLIARKPSGQVG